MDKAERRSAQMKMDAARRALAALRYLWPKQPPTRPSPGATPAAHPPFAHAIAQTVKRYGIATVEGYWSAAACNAALKVIDALDGPGDTHFAHGGYRRSWAHRKENSGVRRFYHIDAEVPMFHAFRRDPQIQVMVDAAAGCRQHSILLHAQRHGSVPFQTRGFHWDTYVPQVKAFLYLTDVTMRCGPFTYVPGSHRQRFVRAAHLFAPAPEASTDLHPALATTFMRRATPITAPAGTLIIADVAGVHRGLSPTGGGRTLLMNYFSGRFRDWRPETDDEAAPTPSSSAAARC